MRYSGTPAMGVQTDRLEEGIQRLGRIQGSLWPYDTRRHLAQASMFPAAFHGIEMVIPPEDQITKFRRKIVEALLQTSARPMSPVLVTMVVRNGDPDPDLHIILQCVRHARQWLLQATPEQRKAFCTIASRHRGSPKTTRGPASVLGYHLEKIGLALTSVPSK